jgi:pyruvate dehydrogenase E2 component (dihydrolipoamide acetyltransferase)
MTEGTIAKWLKRDGDTVKRGEAIVEIDTDKATMSFEADAAGTLHLLSAAGDTLAVGAPIASITAAGSPGGAGALAAVADEQAPTKAAPKPAAPVATPARRRDGINASPLARRLATKRGIDLSAIKGTGPHNRILKQDIPATGTSQPTPVVAPAAAAAAATPFTHLQKIVAERMAQAAAVPTFYLETEVAFTKAIELRRQLKLTLDPTPTLNDIIVKAVAMALREHPRLNASYAADSMLLNERIDIAIAIAAGDDLFVPSIAGADALPLPAIALRSAELVTRARDHALTATDLAPATFTITNLGMFGTTRFVPLLNPPQAAILSVGAFSPDQRRLSDGVPETIGSLGLVCDHRIVYGAHGAAFLQTLTHILEAPMRLLL